MARMVIEFYIVKGDDCEKAVRLTGNGLAVPRQGEIVNLQKQDFIVEGVDWSLDYLGDSHAQELRANVMMRR